ncbi:N-acetyltransferase [Campylobacter porcelli]|uniref:Acetyltransferase n=1 Tax=Campylobacter porcelli TaxID=1660073 RepID=A0A1X9SXC4_9BACT|nr:N-acetyltransferase [Campylobacter sp. RM6137]ARR00932.1 acetyltransferase [Campylobacter sp. RM6137]
MIEYKKARLKDIKSMQNLVRPEVESGVILPRSDDEIATNIRSYTLAFDDDRLIGYSALHIHAANLAEIRSLIVDLDYRGKSVGSNIVKALLDEAKSMEITQVFTLTYRSRFFENLGFIQIPKERLPAQKIWADCIKCKHFLVCNEIALIRNL